MTPPPNKHVRQIGQQHLHPIVSHQRHPPLNILTRPRIIPQIRLSVPPIIQRETLIRIRLIPQRNRMVIRLHHQRQNISSLLKKKSRRKSRPRPQIWIQLTNRVRHIPPLLHKTPELLSHQRCRLPVIRTPITFQIILNTLTLPKNLHHSQLFQQTINFIRNIGININISPRLINCPALHPSIILIRNWSIINKLNLVRVTLTPLPPPPHPQHPQKRCNSQPCQELHQKVLQHPSKILKHHALTSISTSTRSSFSKDTSPHTDITRSPLTKISTPALVQPRIPFASPMKTSSSPPI